MNKGQIPCFTNNPQARVVRAGETPYRLCGMGMLGDEGFVCDAFLVEGPAHFDSAESNKG